MHNKKSLHSINGSSLIEFVCVIPVLGMIMTLIGWYGWYGYSKTTAQDYAYAQIIWLSRSHLHMPPIDASYAQSRENTNEYWQSVYGFGYLYSDEDLRYSGATIIEYIITDPKRFGSQVDSGVTPHDPNASLLVLYSPFASCNDSTATSAEGACNK